MARYAYNGTNLDLFTAMTAVTASTQSVSIAGIFSATFTAPNITNKCTGVWVFIHSLPSLSNIILTLQESTVDRVSSTLVLADIQVGWNYARFTVPYQFTTLTAGAYRFKATNASGSGSIRIDGTLFAYGATIDNTIAVTSLVAAADDLWVAGIHNTGLTAQSLTLSGTTMSFGSGTDKAINATTAQSNGAAITVGNGGTVKMDNTANCTVQVRGSTFVTRNGLFDKRPSSNLSIVSKLIIDCETANGNYGLFTASAAYGGQILTTGKTVPYMAQFTSGLGTAASPAITVANHGFSVGDELAFGGATDYLKNEVRFVISIPALNQLVLSSTLGGVENALVQTHAANSYIGNLWRNSIVSSLTTTRGFWLMNSTSNTTPVSDFSYTRFEYPNIASGQGTQINSQGNEAGCDGSVWYHSAASGRATITIQSTATRTITGLIMYNQQGTNYAGQSGIQVQASNKTLVDCLGFNAPSTALHTALMGFLSSTNCTATNCHSYGANAVNGTIGYGIGIYSSSGITFNSCTVNGSRVQAVYMSAGQSVVFNNCNFGDVGSNTIDLAIASLTLNTVLFSNCVLGSATIISNYLNGLEGSDIAYQDMSGNTSRHRWYTNRGSFWSSGVGLTNTTVRTAGSLALAIIPENSTLGSEMFFKVPANPASNVQVYGYMNRNAIFSSGDITVDLFLPGTLLTSTPNATTTLTTATGAWQLWSINAYNAGTVARYAIVRIRAKTATAGAIVFLDDIYDAATNNKVAGLDVWDAGHISPIMLALDLSALPEQTRVAVWSDSNIYLPGAKGNQQDLSDDNNRLIKGIYTKT